MRITNPMVKAVLLALIAVAVSGTVLKVDAFAPVPGQPCTEVLITSFPDDPDLLGYADTWTYSIAINEEYWPTEYSNGTYNTAAILNWAEDNHPDLYVLLLHELGWHLALNEAGHARHGIGYKYPLDTSHTEEEAEYIEGMVNVFFPNVCTTNQMRYDF